jgi:hypothetical protein
VAGSTPPKPSRVELRLLNAQTEIMSRLWGERFELSFNHSFLCSVNLPHRRPPDDVREVQRSSGDISMLLEAGQLPDPSGGFIKQGLPYGPRARLLLLHICSEAVRTNSPEVEVKDSFTGFAKELGLSVNGRALKSLREQVNRMSVVKMALTRRNGEQFLMFQDYVFHKLAGQFPKNPNQTQLWTSHIELNHDFYQSLKKHAIPLDKTAIAALKHSSRSMDIYCWLASRLWRVHPARPVKLRWTTLRFQFGRPSQKMSSFKRAFIAALKQVLAVYPDADVEQVYGGILLKHSAPPVEMRNTKLLG